MIGRPGCLPELDERSVSYVAGISHIKKNLKKSLTKKVCVIILDVPHSGIATIGG
jgi:hypothetical protein